MSVLSYISGSIIAPNLAGYLISNKLTAISKSNLEKSILEKVSVFNDSFKDTEVDSQKLVDFLSIDDKKLIIFDKVFKSHRAANSTQEVFALELAQEAISYINENRNKDYPQILRVDVMQDYFVSLLSHLSELRDSILSTSEQAVVSIVDESINMSEMNIIEELNRKLDKNVLLSEKISLLNEAFDKGIYDDTLELIEETFYTVSMSNEQRLELLYLKARILVNLNKPKVLEKTKGQIKKINPSNSYVYDIEYWLAYLKQDDNAIIVSLDVMRANGIDELHIKLKQSSYCILKGKFDDALDILLNKKGEIKSEFIAARKAYIQVGIVQLNKNDFQRAYRSFKSALDIKYSIEADYYCIVSETLIFASNLPPTFQVNEKLIENATVLAERMKQVEYYLRFTSKSVKQNHWIHYLSVLGISNPEYALVESKRLDEDIRESKQIKFVLSEIQYQLRNFSDASYLYSEICDEHPVYKARLLSCYQELGEWEKIEAIFENDVDMIYDQDGMILYHQLMMFERKCDYPSIIKLLNDLESMNYEHPIIVDFVIRTSFKYCDLEMTQRFIEIMHRVSQTLSIREKLEFARTLFKQEEFEELRNLLENDIYEDEDALEIYIASYGEVNTENEYFEGLRSVVQKCYSRGIRFRYLLQTKFYIEFFTERYGASIHTLNEYKELSGNDSFFKMNYVQVVIHGNLQNDATQEARELLESDDLSYRIMASQYYAYKGRWDEAKSQLVDSYYQKCDQISEKEIRGFVQIYFNNAQRDSQEKKLIKASNDTVIALESEVGKKVLICLHSSDANVKANGEQNFNCRNYRCSSDEALSLMALADEGSTIDYDGEKYIVNEIVETYVHLFRYFFSKIHKEGSYIKGLIKFSGSSTDEMVEKMRVHMLESKKYTQIRLDNYNFEVETGTPLMYLSGKSPEKYRSIFDYLLEKDEYCLYSAMNTLEDYSLDYVLSLSSIFILKKFGLINKLERISGRVIITEGIKKFIKNGLNDAINSENVKGTSFLDNQNRFRIVETTDKEKLENRRYWNDLLKCINQFKEHCDVEFNTDIYDAMYEMIDVSDFESIELSKRSNSNLVCDDWFIARLNEGIGRCKSAIGSIELLYIEGLLSIDELFDVSLRASEKKLINGISADMLYELYRDVIHSNEESKFEQLKEIFINLFSGEYNDFQMIVYQKLLNMIELDGVMTATFYELIQEPFNLVPYEDFVIDFVNNIRFRIEITDSENSNI